MTSALSSQPSKPLQMLHLTLLKLPFSREMNRILRQSSIRAAAAALIFSAGVFSFGCTQKDPAKKNLASLTKVSDGIYTIDCYSDYKVDEYLKAGITNVQNYDIWMTENLTNGVPTGDIPDTGCSSFTVSDPQGDHLFGRNYDSSKGDALIIRTMPQDGYASIGIADLKHVNLGVGGDYDINDSNSQSLLFAAPWCICDGINEKGLGASLLELSNKHVVNDTSKDDLLLYSAIRVILDKCATVEEAVTLLGNYDMYSPRSNSYHIFITDKSGRSVIAEWTDEGEMVITDDNAVTNYPLYPADPYQDYDHRCAKIHRRIDDVSSMNVNEAMGVLEAVNHDTRWSAVYDLEKFTVDVCFSGDYSKTYSYSGKK